MNVCRLAYLNVKNCNDDACYSCSWNEPEEVVLAKMHEVRNWEASLKQRVALLND